MANGIVKGIMVYGISTESLQKKTLIKRNIKAGSEGAFKEGTVFIGKRMADNLRVSLGDTITFLIPDAIITPFGKLPKEETLKIAGIFEVGMNEYDKNIAFIPIAAAQKLFNHKGSVSNIEIYVNDIENVRVITKKLSSALGRLYDVLDWQHSDASIFHAVVVEKNVMTLILSIIILVAAFNIISGLTMLTNSKMRDIAILRTIGVTRRKISEIFFLIGTIVGTCGTIFGVALGLAVSLNIDRIKQFLEKFSNSDLFSEEIYFLSQIPSKTDFLETCCVVLFSFTLCLLATYYPARKASRLEPIEILRIF
jgi:lipoprotein-releasing system permease protein